VFRTESDQTSTTSPPPKLIESPLDSDIQIRNILDTAMDGIISMNSHQKIVLFNAAAETIFGWRAEQVLGKSIDILISERFHEQHHADVKQCIG
jgi:PAS domain S-box-containing protein